jgi:hypothetical protein
MVLLQRSRRAGGMGGVLLGFCVLSPDTAALRPLALHRRTHPCQVRCRRFLRIERNPMLDRAAVAIPHLFIAIPNSSAVTHT